MELGISEASRALPTLAKLLAQVFYHRRGARYLRPALLQPFKLVQEVAACWRRQPLHIFQYPAGLFHLQRVFRRFNEALTMSPSTERGVEEIHKTTPS